MFDVFYKKQPLGLFPFERPAESLEHAANLSRTEFFWFVETAMDASTVDWDWQPPPWEADQVHVFPSQWQKTGGLYLARKWSAGNKTYHFRSEFSVTALPDLSNWKIPKHISTEFFDYSWHPDTTEEPYEYHFGTQWQLAGGPVYQGTAGIKFVTVQKALALPNKAAWIVPDNIDDSDFDYSWHPDPLELPYEYRFPTQWQKEGGPIYPGTAGIKFVSAQKIKANATQIFYMDFNNPGSKEQFNALKERFPDIKGTRYVESHLTVFKRIVNLATTEFVWIVSSVCDYSNFDFTWHPKASQREMIHCFASNDQKRGDTFYVHVQSFKNQMYELELLDWFNVINYVEDISVRRINMPIHLYYGDNLIEEVKNYHFATPYVMFSNQHDVTIYNQPCLWTEKDRVVQSFTESNSICTVPRDVKVYLQSQMYDYPYISTSKTRNLFAEMPLDIVYISNGEPNEEEYYSWLNYNCNHTFAPGKIHWVRGVNGRTAAYQEAARRSTTPWFFATFAKLRVDSKFDFNWKPDYFQEPKHYVFHAKNPVNGLVYGHMAMIAYNKKLVLSTEQTGLDFTLSAAHEVVPILSGTAEYNQDEWTTWRTAFREVLKLKHFSTETTDVETQHRLKVWLTKASGKHSEWSLLGAQDAVEYFESVGGDFEKLKLSYEWDWLNQYYNSKYKK